MTHTTEIYLKISTKKYFQTHKFEQFHKFIAVKQMYKCTAIIYASRAIILRPL